MQKADQARRWAIKKRNEWIAQLRDVDNRIFEVPNTIWFEDPRRGNEINMNRLDELIRNGTIRRLLDAMIESREQMGDYLFEYLGLKWPMLETRLIAVQTNIDALIEWIEEWEQWEANGRDDDDRSTLMTGAGTLLPRITHRER